MARGAEAKQKVTQKILETFPNSFQYNKEIRIPILENGEELQIKVSLTCAKDTVSGSESSSERSPAQEPSSEEKRKVEELIKKLGI